MGILAPRAAILGAVMQKQIESAIIPRSGSSLFAPAPPRLGGPGHRLPPAWPGPFCRVLGGVRFVTLLAFRGVIANANRVAKTTWKIMLRSQVDRNYPYA